ncbi:hypothetical protein DFS28_103418 [Pseudomonas sp. 478]|jgi:iron complex outermembrane receptor protein|uniref:hypothetical protein n=1 Tax=unclassified Pseudomonas TaxID=196821 RepID=UPI000DB17F89|nr:MULTISPECIES: hypothetical protein [unclassified Pseudomonas]PZW99348.1 hypothetical protein DFS28_103418 [Pseudomonas sp. 478]TCV49110.1 hypothetical protein EDB99_113142 [Pseudomonas sp. 460]
MNRSNEPAESLQQDLRAALNNISDKTYYSSATSAAQIQPGEPRSLVVTGTYRL